MVQGQNELKARNSLFVTLGMNILNHRFFNIRTQFLRLKKAKQSWVPNFQKISSANET